MKQLRQAVESHAGWLGAEGEQFTGLVVTLNANHLLGGDMDAAQRFNSLSAADRVREACRLLSQAGAKGVAPPVCATRGRAADADASPGVRRLMRDYNARPIAVGRRFDAARLHRTLDRVLDEMLKRRRPARDCDRRDERENRVAADAAVWLPPTKPMPAHFRTGGRAADAARPLSDLEAFERDAARTMGGC
jgi:hypothetical protein